MNENANYTSGILQTEGGPLWYEVSGQGHPLVLIHAGVADHRMWDDQMPAFTQRYRVVRYDTRDFGKSPLPREGHEFSDRQDLYELLKHLGIDSAYVIGVSRAGQIAVDFTLEHPEMVDALIPVAAGLSGHDYKPTDDEMALFTKMEELWEKGEYEELAELEVRLWVDGPGQPEDRVDPQIREKVRQMIVENYRAHRIEGKPIRLDPPAAGRLGEVKAPTLVIVGDLDGPGVLSACDAIASGIPGARKVVFPSTAHMLNMEQPEKFNRVVLDFLGSLGA